MTGLSRRWDVPDEFWNLWWRSREHRQLIIDAAVQPASKEGRVGRRSAPEFQRQVMDQMERYRRYPMRGLVALDLHFRAAQRNPPWLPAGDADLRPWKQAATHGRLPRLAEVGQ